MKNRKQQQPADNTDEEKVSLEDMKGKVDADPDRQSDQPAD